MHCCFRQLMVQFVFVLSVYIKDMSLFMYWAAYALIQKGTRAPEYLQNSCVDVNTLNTHMYKNTWLLDAQNHLLSSECDTFII